MKALIILYHSWSPFFLLFFIYMEKIFGALCVLLEYFCNKKLPYFQENSFVISDTLITLVQYNKTW